MASLPGQVSASSVPSTTGVRGGCTRPPPPPLVAAFIEMPAGFARRTTSPRLFGSPPHGKAAAWVAMDAATSIRRRLIISQLLKRLAMPRDNEVKWRRRHGL